MNDRESEDRRRLIDRLFPPRYDFHQMLQEQAEATVTGIQALVDWISEGTLGEPRELMMFEEEADEIRHRMEDRLIEAFSTPFDRQDIYTISRQMDQILNYATSTALEMRAFRINPDRSISDMSRALLRAAKLISDAVRFMEESPERTESVIKSIRACEHDIEEIYIASMSRLFKLGDAMEALKRREIYHHMKDAARNLSITVDTLHRILVALP